MKPNSLSTLLLVAAVGFCAAASAQAPGFRRTVVQKGDVSIPNREAVVARVEVDPGVTSGRHTHPGDEISYVLEGEGELLIDGEAPRKIKAGDAFIVPAGKVHEARGTGTVTMKLVGTYVVEKGQPMATPAAK